MGCGRKREKEYIGRERDGRSKKRRERGDVPIWLVVGDREIASAKCKEREREIERGREDKVGVGGKTNSPVRENPTWRKRKSGRECGTRKASRERNRESAGLVEERENHGGF